METTILIILITILIVWTGFNYTRAIYKDEQRFNLQMAMSNNISTDHIIKLPFKELTNIINELINFFTSQAIATSGIRGKSDDEKSLLIDNMIASVSTSVLTSLSSVVIAAFTNYTSEEYLKIYIKDTVRLVLIARLEKR